MKRKKKSDPNRSVNRPDAEKQPMEWMTPCTQKHLKTSKRGCHACTKPRRRPFRSRRSPETLNSEYFLQTPFILTRIFHQVLPRPQICEFCACIFFSLSSNALRQILLKCATFLPIFPRRKGLTALQRGRRCRATGTPLHDNGMLIADQRGPYGSTADRILNDKRDFSVGLQRF